MRAPSVIKLPLRAFQWDLARQAERLDFLLGLLPKYAEWGYRELYLHLEDAVEYPSLPGVGRVDAYSYTELQRLVETAGKVGIHVVPIVNLLGHTQYLIKHPDWQDLNELRASDGSPLARGQICPLHPRFGEVARRLISDLAPLCTAGKMHVGLDESFHLGKCPRCRAEVEAVGLGGHFARHVNRLHQTCTDHSLQMGIWADMLYFVPEAISQLPRGIIAYDWYYYAFGGKPRVEFFNFAERDLAPALKRQGIAYYGCPMNGAFRHEPLPVFGDRLGNIRSWWTRCCKKKADGFLITSWEANRLALETTTVVDAAAAGLWLEPEGDDNTALLAGGLNRALAAREPGALARQLLAADAHAFSGYARWQINDRWDVFAGQESVQPYRDEARFFARLEKQTKSAPVALAASVAFRRYLAERDVLVRELARATLELRRLEAKRQEKEFTTLLKTCEDALVAFRSTLALGQAAARIMWRRSRDPNEAGPNALNLLADKRRLAGLMAWFRTLRKNPGQVVAASPLVGAWQLQFMVHNPEPAVQRVAVEQQQTDGTWRELAARHTIEFRNSAARSRTRLKREFSVPVETPDVPLRIVLRGTGRVAISHVFLTDGKVTEKSPAFRQRKVLGRKAPTQGLPDPTAVQDVMAVTFAKKKARHEPRLR